MEKHIRIERNGEKLKNEDLNAILRMAKSGDVNAQYSFGLVYYYGQGPEVDFKEAGKWLKMAAEKGHSEAQYVLGQIHIAGDSAEDIEGAIYWLELASKDTDLKCAKELLLKQAYLKYVIIYLMGCTIPNEKTGITEDMHNLAIKIRACLMLRDYGSSIKVMKLLDGKTKDRNLNEYAKRSLIYLNEINNFIGSKDDSGTVQPWGLYIENKETGEILTIPKDKNIVGGKNSSSLVKKVSPKSEGKIKRASNDKKINSDEDDKYRIGLEALSRKDYDTAGENFHLAAIAGNAKAQYIYGKMLLYGTGVKKSIDKGIHFLETSSNKGYAKAAKNLGDVYEKGILIQKDLKKAEELYRRAVELGDESARQLINNFKKEEHKKTSARSHEERTDAIVDLESFWRGLILKTDRMTGLKLITNIEKNKTKTQVLYKMGNISGLYFVYKLNASNWVVRLDIDFGVGNEQKTRDFFDRLQSDSRSIEKTFGHGLTWERGNARGAKITCPPGSGGYNTPGDWPSILSAMAETMKRLEGAIGFIIDGFENEKKQKPLSEKSIVTTEPDMGYKSRPSQKVDASMSYFVTHHDLKNRRFLRSTEFYKNLLYAMGKIETIVRDPKTHLLLGDFGVAAMTPPIFNPKPGSHHMFLFDARGCKRTLEHYLSAGFGVRSKILLDRRKDKLKLSVSEPMADNALKSINIADAESSWKRLSASTRHSSLNPFISKNDPAGLICISIALLSQVPVEEEKILRKKNGLFPRLEKYGMEDFDSRVYEIYVDPDSEDGKALIKSIFELPAEFLVMIRQTTITQIKDIPRERKSLMSRLAETPGGNISRVELINGLKRFPLDQMVLLGSAVHLSHMDLDGTDPDLIFLIAYISGMIFLVNNDHFYEDNVRGGIEGLLSNIEFEYAAEDLSDIGEFISDGEEHMLDANVTRNEMGKMYIGGDSEDEDEDEE